MSKFKNMLRTTEAEESEKLLFWILHKMMEIVCFSAKVRQCIIAYKL